MWNQKKIKTSEMTQCIKFHNIDYTFTLYTNTFSQPSSNNLSDAAKALIPFRAERVKNMSSIMFTSYEQKTSKTGYTPGEQANSIIR